VEKVGQLQLLKMLTLCDTTCLLMLIRMAPEMFIDERFRCCTIHLVRNEIIRTQKFAEKYPWRNEYKDKIRCLSNDFTKDEGRNRYFEAIHSLIENITINEKNGNLFDLSYADQEFLSYALANGFRITTGDKSLRDFALQEFKREFKGNISPLGMINEWIEKGLIKWNDQMHDFLTQWKAKNEHPQPRKQIIKFERLTSRNYPGN